MGPGLKQDPSSHARLSHTLLGSHGKMTFCHGHWKGETQIFVSFNAYIFRSKMLHFDTDFLYEIFVMGLKCYGDWL